MRWILAVMIAVVVGGSAAHAERRRSLGTFGGSSQSGYGTNPNSDYVSGYTRGDGGYVNGYYRTAPNNTDRDNYSTLGNLNPWTGEEGSRSPQSLW